MHTRRTSFQKLAVVMVIAILGLAFLGKAEAQTTNTEAAPLSGGQALFGNEFSAEKNVSKKTFATALAQFLELKPGAKQKCYRDLNARDAATPYICALKKKNILRGSKRTSFKGKTNARWGFVIQSVCRSQKWVKSTTFSSCTSFARKNGLLNAPLPTKISTRMAVTYGQAALLFERVKNFKPAVSSPRQGGGTLPTPPPEAAFVTTVPPRKSSGVPSFTTVSPSTIGQNFFANVTLSAPMPNRFYRDEVYFVEGDLRPGVTASDIFVFLCPANKGCDNSLNFLAKTDGSHFKIPVHFENPGNYQLGIVPGRSGESRVENISVLEEPLETPASGERATQFSVSYSAGKTTFSWNGKGSITRLIIFQGTKRKDYLFRQETTSYSPDSKDFAEFKKGTAGYLIEHDSQRSLTAQFKVTVQEFRKIETDKIQIKSLREVFIGPDKFTVSARSLSPISKKAAITLPNGKVEELFFASGDLSAQADFTIEKNLTAPGTYIFEINNTEGSAVVNIPLYVGSEIPLLPDFFALNEPKLNTAPLGNLNDARTKLLALINIDREAHGLGRVTLASDINTIAQGHSEDMIARNFFGHVNPSGESPDDRRKKAGITTPIRENLGKATSLELVEAGLMRSPIHRAAIIDSKVTRVGLGIEKNSEGYFIVTQNFAISPLKASDLPAIENDLFAQANSLRQMEGLPLLVHDAVLRDVTSVWSSKMATNGFFSTSDPNGDSLIDSARESGVNSGIEAHIVQASDREKMTETFLEQNPLQRSENRKIGIGLAVSAAGDLYMTVIYTP